MQTAVIADAAKLLGLEIGDFDWSLDETPIEDHRGQAFVLKTHRLTHRPTSAWFHFRLGQGVVEWWPPDPSNVRDSMAKTWLEQLDAVTAWLRSVKAEHETPDVWAVAKQHRSLIVGDPSGQFSSDERALLKTKLKEMGHYLSGAITATQEDLSRIEARIDYLVHAVDRLDKLDFKNALLGALTSIAVEFGLQTSQIQGLFAFASQQVAGILGYLRQIGS